jgi:DNA polymerase III subunit gamma/tau
MSVLYRKYRPKKFTEVLGQNHIIKVLSGSIKLGNISHAYLFSGSRGTGKTSVARILAQELNTSESDIYELDAASNRGIDDVREIRDSVSTLPYSSKYKVYIIDEAHMLTKEAWNALLKTLEEPPPHVIFVLATTEIEKVPDTVVSRCQSFSFKSPNQAMLRDFALSIAEAEDTKLESDAAELVALLGDGSFRDTHGILEKVFASSKSKKITREEVEDVTGAPRSELVNQILEAVVEGDLEKGLKVIAIAVEANSNMKFFTKLILERMRYLFLIRLKAGMNDYIAQQVSEDDFKFLENLAHKAGLNLTSDVLLRFITAYEDADRTTIPELALELALVDSIVTDKE